MRPEHRQRLHHMWVLLRRETRTYPDHVVVKVISLLLFRLAHCGRSVEWRAPMRPDCPDPRRRRAVVWPPNPGINAHRFQRRRHMPRQTAFSGLGFPVNASATAMSTSLARNGVRAG